MVSSLATSPLADFGAAVWRADELAVANGAVVASGHPALAAQLPGGGWPVGAISEILQAQSGVHEWRLMLPALTYLQRAVAGPVVLVGPPYAPFGPGLAAQGLAVPRLLWVDVREPAARLWAAQQALCCAEVAAVLAWLPQVRAEQLRRLQLAAQAHNKLLFVLRPDQAQGEPSPAALRLLLSSPPAEADAAADTLLVHILKRRGPPLMHPLVLPARHARLGALLALSGPGGQARNQREKGDALDCVAAAA